MAARFIPFVFFLATSKRSEHIALGTTYCSKWSGDDIFKELDILMNTIYGRKFERQTLETCNTVRLPFSTCVGYSSTPNRPACSCHRH
jgi:hypothetical protein